ncbi:MAG: putative Holliday junction resolvase [Rhodothermales bacterium]|jgi:putative Holliday junction resolvase
MTGLTGGRAVGVDVGTKKVGLAMTDPLRMFVQPVGTYEPNSALAELKRIHSGDGIGVAVVGWPLTEEGKEGTATRMVNIYIRRMRKAIRGLKVVRQDERYTSEEARSRLADAGSSGKIDTMAAGIILQEYLEGEGNEPAAAGNVSGPSRSPSP